PWAACDISGLTSDVASGAELWFERPGFRPSCLPGTPLAGGRRTRCLPVSARHVRRRALVSGESRLPTSGQTRVGSGPRTRAAQDARACPVPTARDML